MTADRLLLAEPVLLIGFDGMLGRAWHELLLGRGIEAVCPSLDELDLTNTESLEPITAGKHPLVINCAAYTDVDGAEAHEAQAMIVNAEGAGALARACKKGGALLIHYSTDYVFNGSATTPYTPAEPRQPIGAYGRSKARGEEFIEKSGCEHLIIRTSWLYGPWGTNFVRTIRTLVSKRPVIRVVDDQRGRPTSVLHLADLSRRLIQRGARGVWHGTDSGECTWFEFALEIARLTSGAGEVEPCTTDEFPRPAPRPAYSVLEISETERFVGPLPHWKNSLAQVLARILESENADAKATS